MYGRLPSLPIALITLMLAIPGAVDAAWWIDGNPVCELPQVQEQPELISDGAGGMIVVWADRRSGTRFDIYAQRLDGSGNAMWAPNGVFVVDGQSSSGLVDVIPDAGHGAIIVWKPDVSGPDIHVQRIDETGANLWNPEVKEIHPVGSANVVATSDGAGGVILAWEVYASPSYDVFAQRIDANGNEVWNPDGILMLDPAFQDETAPCIVADGSGGAFVAVRSQGTATVEIRCQRIYASGSKWGTDGTMVMVAGTWDLLHPAITEDGSGGVYVVCERFDGETSSIWAQRLNGAGAKSWTTPTNVCTALGSEEYPDVINDGFGNLVVCWQDTRVGYDIYAQKIDEFGTAVWGSKEAMPICTDGYDQLKPRLLSGAGSNLVVTWHDSRGYEYIGAQAIDVAGGILWAPDGVEVLRGELFDYDYDVASDGAGGILATVKEDRFSEMDDIYAQAVNSLGNMYAAEPTIVGIADVPDDQGGWVQITIGRSDRDDLAINENSVTHYDVWRQIPPPTASPELIEALAATTPSTSSGIRSVDRGDRRFISVPDRAVIPGGFWERIGSFAATQDYEYFYRAPTLTDWSQGSRPVSTYFISAHTTDPEVWFAGEPDSGYSLDNIAPHVPAGFMVTYNTGGGNQLIWDESPDNDFKYFRIYRDEDPGFTPSGANYVNGTVDTQWLDTVTDGWKYHYKITAVDMADNESGEAEGTMTGTGWPSFPEQVTLGQNVPNPFNPSTSITFGLPADGQAKLSIYRVNGELVRVLLDEHISAGFRTVSWNGLDGMGNRAGSGVFLYRLETERTTVTRKMLLLK